MHVSYVDIIYCAANSVFLAKSDTTEPVSHLSMVSDITYNILCSPRVLQVKSVEQLHLYILSFWFFFCVSGITRHPAAPLIAS